MRLLRTVEQSLEPGPAPIAQWMPVRSVLLPEGHESVERFPPGDVLGNVLEPGWGSRHTCAQLSGPEAGLSADGNAVLGPILDPPGQEQHEPEAVWDCEGFNRPAGCCGKAQGEKRLSAAVAELGAP